MYYLKHEILLIVLRPVCFLGPDIFPYVEIVCKTEATSALPLHKHCTRSNNFLLCNSQLGLSLQRNVYTFS